MQAQSSGYVLIGPASGRHEPYKRADQGEEKTFTVRIPITRDYIEDIINELGTGGIILDGDIIQKKDWSGDRVVVTFAREIDVGGQRLRTKVITFRNVVNAIQKYIDTGKKWDTRHDSDVYDWILQYAMFGRPHVIA